MLSQREIYSFFVFIFLLICQKSQAQIGDSSYNGINDPLSFYGYGTIQYDGLQNGWMKGHTGVATTDAFSPNVINPASLSYIALTSVDFGMEGASSATGNKSQTINSGGFYPVYFNLSMPVGKRGGLSLGMNQKFRTLYRIRSQGERKLGDSMVNVRESLQGNGSMNSLKIAGAYRPIENLSIGLSVFYNFGNQTQEQYIQFVDSLYLQGTSYYTNWVAHGFTYQIGANYKVLLGTDSMKSLAVAASYTPAKPISVSEESLSRNFLINPNNQLSDTFSQRMDQKGGLGMPSAYELGLEYNLRDKLILNLDYTAMDFSASEFIGEKQNLYTYSRYSFGAGYTSTRNFAKPAFSRATYSTGFYFGNDYFKTDGGQVNFWGITGGISLPMLRNLGEVRFGVEYNNRGDINRNRVNTRNTLFRLGITFSDKWFQKRFYD